MRLWVAFGVGAVAVLIGCGGGGGGGSSTSVTTVTTATTAGDFFIAQDRLLKAGQGMLLYANDNDDTLPLNNRWMDATAPYTKDETAFRSPFVEIDGGYGFAFNSALVGRNLNSIGDRDESIMLFDSTVVVRNATAALTTRPNPGRYGGKNAEVTAAGNQTEPGPVTLEEARRRLDRSNTGLLLYAADADDMLPPATWMDSLSPYTGSDRYFRSPVYDTAPSSYGFALNGAIAGKPLSEFETPKTTVSIFDSTVLTRNAVAATSTLPTAGRIAGKNVIGYLDGHSESKAP